MNTALSFVAGLRDVNPGVYCADDFRAIAHLIHAEAGIMLPGRKATLVYARLAPRVRDTGCGTFAAYVKLIDRDPDERRRAIGALTTNYTFFNREAHHFKHFAEHVRPDLIRKLKAGGAVRLWSAGCASGEETWSLVMALLGEDKGEGRQIAAADVRVLGSDIAGEALARAKEASYDADALAQVPLQLRRNWTTKIGATLVLAAEAQAIVRIRALNLHGQWPMKGRFEAIFCRNVMIYFDQPAKDRLTARFADYLVPGGHLYIGHSEQISGPAASRFDCIGITTFRRKP